MTAVDIPLPPHGGQLAWIARQFGVDAQKLIDFSASISPYPPPSHVLERLRTCSTDPKFLSRYPDLEYRDLKTAIAAYADVPSQSVMVANGIMPLLEAAVHALGLNRCLVVEPSFPGYKRTLHAAGVETVGWPLDPALAFSLPVEPLLATVASGQCDSILLANPHSPSGAVESAATLEELCRRAAHLQATVLLDEAFIDFEPERSLCSIAARFRNLIVFRSLTKFFAIPALRVGYAVAAPEIVDAVSRRISEWPIGSLAAMAAIELLGAVDHQRQVRESTIEERDRLSGVVKRLGFAAFPGRANYLLIRFGNEKVGINAWQSLILDHGIVSRCCNNFAGLDAGYHRFSIRTKEENCLLAEAIASLSAKR